MYRVRRSVAQIQGREGRKSRKDNPGSRLEVAGGVSRGWETAGWRGCVEAVLCEELAEGGGGVGLRRWCVGPNPSPEGMLHLL